MPRSAKANQEIRAATRATIIESGMTLFANDGYAPTSIRKIAKQADISVGLMYHYFESKEALLTAVFEECTRMMDAAFIHVYPSQLEQPTPAERLGGLIRAIFEQVEKDRPFWTLFYALRAQPAAKSVFGDREKVMMQHMRQMFAFEFRSADRPQPDIDAIMLHNLVEGTIQHYLKDPAGFPLGEVVEQMALEVTRKVNSKQ